MTNVMTCHYVLLVINTKINNIITSHSVLIQCNQFCHQISKLNIFTVLIKTIMPSSHRRHGQDNTVLSCLVRVGGVNWVLVAYIYSRDSRTV